MRALFIIGPSGSGKTTLSSKLSQIYSDMLGQGQICTVNLDCANIKSTSNIDICELISLQDVMQIQQLGPNGGLIYAIKFLDKNIDWLYDKIEQFVVKNNPAFKILKQKNIQKNKQKTQQYSYITLIFDLPGQIQLYIMQEQLNQIIQKLHQKYQLSSIFLNLFDSCYIYQINNFISICLTALCSLVNLDRTHLCLLSKIDILKGKRPPNGILLDYFSLCSLSQLSADLGQQKSQMLNAFTKIVDQNNRLSFIPISSEKEDLISYLIFQIQRSFGTMQQMLLGSKYFYNLVEQFLKPHSFAALVNNLQGWLYENEQQDYLEQLEMLKKQLQNNKS